MNSQSNETFHVASPCKHGTLSGNDLADLEICAKYFDGNWDTMYIDVISVNAPCPGYINKCCGLACSLCSESRITFDVSICLDNGHPDYYDRIIAGGLGILGEYLPDIPNINDYITVTRNK